MEVITRTHIRKLKKVWPLGTAANLVHKLKRKLTFKKDTLNLIRENYIQLHGELFEAVQLNKIFPDSKTFVDCIPKKSSDAILADFEIEKLKLEFDLKSFVLNNFYLPEVITADKPSLGETNSKSIENYLNNAWADLSRDADPRKTAQNTLLSLPFPYIVPGGRFREIFYWDSYFTALGLLVSNRIEAVENLCNNFTYLTKKIGHIPNGNRLYMLSRSQPPIFARLVDILSKWTNKPYYEKYYEYIEQEYLYWMQGESTVEGSGINHVVKYKNNVLNRYFDELDLPREEAHHEDIEIASEIEEDQRPALFRSIRAACESGWDFSSRWLRDNHHLHTICTTEILPIDLNCVLFMTEKKLSEWSKELKDNQKSAYYARRAEQRAEAIRKLFYDDSREFFFDFYYKDNKHSDNYNLAALYPLFVGVATQEQADNVASIVKDHFLKEGGLITTLYTTGQQWDSPNGWAPLQWVAIRGLRKYGHHKLADEIKKRWIDCNTKKFEETGFMFEKYNVVEDERKASGGEYPVQTGFGWTNGVLLALLHEEKFN